LKTGCRFSVIVKLGLKSGVNNIKSCGNKKYNALFMPGFDRKQHIFIARVLEADFTIADSSKV
jgi:oligoribonuclease NrnB/cAMP/cGMP phosphodiesterase (DHH superfamily)